MGTSLSIRICASGSLLDHRKRTKYGEPARKSPDIVLSPSATSNQTETMTTQESKMQMFHGSCWFKSYSVNDVFV